MGNSGSCRATLLGRAAQFKDDWKNSTDVIEPMPARDAPTLNEEEAPGKVAGRLYQIAGFRHVGAHAIVLLDQAGWHGGKVLKVPSNMSLMPLPPRAPELNPQENIWQFMRQNWLSNRIFKSFDDIVDHCCYAWNILIDQPWKIMSIARREWAVVGQPI